MFEYGFKWGEMTSANSMKEEMDMSEISILGKLETQTAKHQMFSSTRSKTIANILRIGMEFK